MNNNAANLEWAVTRLVLSHSDHLLFLLNLISYSLTPGLIFSVFRKLAVG